MQQLTNGNVEALTQASLIFILAIAIIILNLLVIATFLNFRGKLHFIADTKWLTDFRFAGPQEVINIYILSLAFTDLILAIVIIPLSIYPALQSGKLITISRLFIWPLCLFQSNMRRVGSRRVMISHKSCVESRVTSKFHCSQLPWVCHATSWVVSWRDSNVCPETFTYLFSTARNRSALTSLIPFSFIHSCGYL